MADHAHLLRNDVELLAGLHANLPQHGTVVRTDTLGLGQFVAHHLARQRRVQRLAPALGPFVSGDLDSVVVGLGFFLGRLGCRSKRLGLVEEHVLLVAGAGLALGGEQLALELVELLLEQVALGARDAQLTSERFAGLGGLGQRLLQGCKFFGGGHVNHRLLRSACRSGGSLCWGFCGKYSQQWPCSFRQHQPHATRS